MKDEFLSPSEHDRIYKCFECGKRIIYERYDKRIASGDLVKVNIGKQEYVFHKKCHESVIEKFYENKERYSKKVKQIACAHCGKNFKMALFDQQMKKGLIVTTKPKEGTKTFHLNCYKLFIKENSE